MSNRRQFWVFGLVLILIFTLLGGTIGFADQEEPKRGGTLRVAVTHGLESLNPRVTGWMNEAYNALYEPLINRDWKNRYKPGLAKSWEFSKNGRQLTLYLREDVEFHDGTKFDAEVVEWYFEEFMGGVVQYIVDPIENVEATDEYTVVLQFKRPYINILYNLSNSYGGLVPSPTAVKKVGLDEYGVDVVVGTGPFKLKERVSNTKMVLERFEKYDWGPEWSENKGSAYLDKIVYEVIPETVTRTAELETGGVDAIVTGVPTIKLESFEQNPDIKVIRGPARQLSWVAFNMDKEESPIIAGDLRIRKAISFAIDREAIREGVYNGTGEINGTYLPPMIAAQDIPEEFRHYYDLEKARNLLEEAGWVDENGDGIREKDGVKLSLKTIMVKRSEDARIGVILKDLLKDVGIELKLEKMDEAALTSVQKTGQWDLCIEDYVWDNADILQWFFCSSMLPYPNWFALSDPKLDHMIEEVAMAQPNNEKRTEKFKEAHIYLLTELVPAAPTHTQVKLQAVQKYVRGWRYKLVNKSMLNVWSDK
ncbi:ABC transporter substrate-binding protein [Candidatus Bipolaricaulota bacterium]|nr:ABC transporter substrate-binding protein [Candidatus Bipolaricaulota bacterium]